MAEISSCCICVKGSTCKVFGDAYWGTPMGLPGPSVVRLQPEILPMIFERLESNVRYYCRSTAATFSRASGSYMFDESGREYIDFFAGAGSLNYGHNHPEIKNAVLSYLNNDGISQGLDFHTVAKREFLEDFERFVLEPARLDYKVQFCGPSGTEGVEAALKLARKIKGATNVIAFSGAYHGLSRGSVATTSGRQHRAGAIPPGPVTFAPYPFGFGTSFDTLEYLRSALEDPSSGVDRPCAVIVEAVQGEGGVCIAPAKWLRGLREICDQKELLLILDDIQMGCYRTGAFFSFTDAGITPDMVVLSKSIGGFGSPMSLLLMKPELDVWTPGEHAGTFRGNQLAFVGGSAALKYAASVGLEEMVRQREALAQEILRRNLGDIGGLDIRGRGLIWGLDLSESGPSGLAKRAAAQCFQNGLIIETCGREQSVLKMCPPLNIEVETLLRGCEILVRAVKDAIS